jgi:hypothetical protein
MIMFHELEKWIKDNGRPPSFSRGRLGSWIATQRREYKDGHLSKEQIKRLKVLIPLGGHLRLMQVRDRVDRLIAHFKKGTMETANEDIKYDLHRICVLHKAKKLPGNALADLRKGGVPIETLLTEMTWLKKIKDLVDHYERKGELPKKDLDYNLYKLCLREKKYLNQAHPYAKFIRKDKDAGKLYQKVRKIAAMIGVSDWDDRYLAIKKVASKHGCLSIKNCDGNALQWMRRQRVLLRENKLPSGKAKKLLSIKEVDWYGASKDRHPQVKRPEGK